MVTFSQEEDYIKWLSFAISHFLRCYSTVSYWQMRLNALGLLGEDLNLLTDSSILPEVEAN